MLYKTLEKAPDSWFGDSGLGAPKPLPGAKKKGSGSLLWKLTPALAKLPGFAALVEIPPGLIAEALKDFLKKPLRTNGSLLKHVRYTPMKNV